VKKTVIGSAVILGTALALAASMGGCGSNSQNNGSSGGQTPGHTGFGNIKTELSVAPGENITSVNWTITQGTTTVLSGTFAVPAAATSISFNIPNVPAGTGYVLSLSAVTADGTISCAGSSAPFTVTALQTTNVQVYLTCTTSAGTDAGAVQVNGNPEPCATWTSASATPASQVPGGTIALAAGAVAPNSATITYLWTATGGGTIASPNSQTTTFTCPAAASSVSITLLVGDGATLLDGAAFTCPAATSSTTLNVLCGNPPCFGIGTGTVATPNSATGTCPAGQSNSLKDGTNFCCAAIPCFGIGTGIEASPDNATGTCPAGQANTLTDAQGNFCCATAVLAPCTKVGQPNCVACNNGSANSLCTPTEAAIVARDIAKGYVTAATASGPTNGCYSCLEGASALDDATDTGLECGDTTNPTACLTTLNCILSSGCEATGANVCYCGTAPVSTTCNVDGTGAANGTCAAQIAAGFGTAVTNGHTILGEFTVKTQPSGGADGIAQRAISNGCNQCWQ
jgi:hypothetical protein